MTKQATEKTAPAKKDAAKTAKWDETDESSSESFPASDAPTSWAGRDIPPDERKTPKQG